jgi:hypothetical protein
MGSWGRAILALGLAAASETAAAETKTLATSGSWEAFGGTTPQGRGVCGISAEVAKRYFGVKFYAGNDTFTIQLGTPEWAVTKGEKVGVTMQLDSNPVWRAGATAFNFEDGDAGLQYHINRAELDNFAREFRNSSLLKLRFENNRLAPWTLGLQGTMAVNGAFQTCIRGLK